MENCALGRGPEKRGEIDLCFFPAGQLGVNLGGAVPQEGDDEDLQRFRISGFLEVGYIGIFDDDLFVLMLRGSGRVNHTAGSFPTTAEGTLGLTAIFASVDAILGRTLDDSGDTVVGFQVGLLDGARMFVPGITFGFERVLRRGASLSYFGVEWALPLVPRFFD